ncbi:MAG TPA: hypothetical protein VNI83_14850 [Vicinamibacterales bacterium]|nr:hypothetical protein [Vicinamibacterales bacterium]
MASVPVDDERLRAERAIADRRYHEAFAALDRAVQAPPAARA